MTGADGTGLPPVPAPRRADPAWGEHRFHRLDGQALNGQAVDLVMLLDSEGNVLTADASDAPILGYDADACVGQNIFALLDEASAPALRASFEDLVARRRLAVSLELRTVRADGSWVDVEVVAVSRLVGAVDGGSAQATDGSAGAVVVTIRDITMRRPVEERALGEVGWHTAIIDSLVDGVIMVDHRGVVVRVNESLNVLFGTRGRWMVGQRFEDLYALSRSFDVETTDAAGRPVLPAQHPLMQSLATGRRFAGVVHQVRSPDAPPLWIRIGSQAIVDDDGSRIAGAMASFSDITGVRQAAMELRREQQFLQVLLDNLDEGIVACDAEGRMTIFNRGAKRLHGVSGHVDPIGKTPSARGIRRVDGSPVVAGENPLVRALAGERVRDVELVLESRSGNRRLVSVNGQTLVDDEGTKLGAVVAMRDITEQRQNEQRLADLALRDPLTGLANRIMLADRLRKAIDERQGEVGAGAGSGAASEGGSGAASEGGSGAGVAVFMLDLDDFKEVNDVCGHDVGDDVLVAVSRRLMSIVGPSSTVARLGGDEFVVVCDVQDGRGQIEATASRISAALSEPYRIDGRVLTVQASVGGVMVDDGTDDVSKLLSRADDAMYRTKWDRRRQRRSVVD